MKIKKHFLVYLAHFVFLFLFARSIPKIDFNDPGIIDIVNIIGAVVLLILIVLLFFNPNLVVIDGNDIKVARRFYGYYRFKKSDIEVFEESKGYSFKLNFKLKNGKKVTVSSFDIPEKSREELMSYFNTRS